jgi:hypothetical protein
MKIFGIPQGTKNEKICSVAKKIFCILMKRAELVQTTKKILK